MNVGVLLLLLTACTTTSPTQRKDAPVVDSLRIQGTKQVDDDELRGKILTAETSPLDWLPFVPEQRFDPIAWQADLRRIERYYESQGFYGARIVSEQVTPTKDGEGVEVLVQVSEGERTRVQAVEVSGLDPLPPEHRKVVMDDFPLKEGEVFREKEWEGVKEELRRRLHEQGYADGSVEGEVEVDVATRQATVRLRIDPGRRYRFGKIFVAPDPRARVRPAWILQQARESIVEGAWFSESALAEAQNRIFAMGVFGAVKVNRAAPDRESGTIPVVVDVREAPFRTLRAGGGVGIDPTRYEARLLTEYTHRNFFGGLRRLTVQGRVGWALIRSGESKAGPVAEITTAFEQPRFLAATLTQQTSLELERGLEPAYDFYGGRLKTGVVWRPWPAVSLYPSYNLEAYRLTGESSFGGRSPELTVGCSGDPCIIVLSYFEQLLEYDRRDDRLEPRNGYYLSLSLQEGGGLLGGNFTYLRLLPEARGYVSFGDDDRLTFGARLRFGTLLPRRSGDNGERRPSDSPIVSRFFGGGGSGMRGFSNRRLSPMVAVPKDDPYEDDGLANPELGMKRGGTVPIGGNGMVESSLEARYNVVGDFVLATFFDSGLVTPGSLYVTEKDYFTYNLFHAVGWGIRYRTLLGPVRFDFAYRLPKGNPLRIEQPADGPALDIEPPGKCLGMFGKTSRSRAGFPEGPCSIHLSIGEAF